jgi:hypothetical protein
VTANPDSWSFDPFKLTIEGDKLLGRGVTDCLGHVALLTELFRQLAQHEPALKATVMGVFIANEENSTVRDPLASLPWPVCDVQSVSLLWALRTAVQPQYSLRAVGSRTMRPAAVYCGATGHLVMVARVYSSLQLQSVLLSPCHAQANSRNSETLFIRSLRLPSLR